MLNFQLDVVYIDGGVEYCPTITYIVYGDPYVLILIDVFIYNRNILFEKNEFVLLSDSPPLKVLEL